MQRDLDGLTSRTFDVLVVGGGIYGLTIAYDAAQRGLSVALIERHDFAGGAAAAVRASARALAHAGCARLARRLSARFGPQPPSQRRRPGIAAAAGGPGGVARRVPRPVRRRSRDDH